MFVHFISIQRQDFVPSSKINVPLCLMAALIFTPTIIGCNYFNKHEIAAAKIQQVVDNHYSAKHAQIDNCKPQFRFKCPKRWHDLEKTGNRNIRLRHQCGEQVFLCHSEDELKSLAIDGKCVALAETYSDVEWMGLVDFEKDDI